MSSRIRVTTTTELAGVRPQDAARVAEVVDMLLGNRRTLADVIRFLRLPEALRHETVRRLGLLGEPHREGTVYRLKDYLGHDPPP